MIKYKLKENCVSANSTDPLRDYLISLGIKRKDVDSFIVAPKQEDEESPWTLSNIHKAIELLHEGFRANKKFFLIVDCDVDGFTSASIFYRYFKLRYPSANIEWMLHEGKEHGIELDKIPMDCDYVIVPDAGSMNLEQHKVLLDAGKTIIILDHHEVSEFIEHDRIAVVNNQCSPMFMNKFSSGAGVTFKTLQAYEQTYPDMYVKISYFYDLVALGLISDMMEMRSLDNNAIVYKGLNNINNEMFKALIQQQAFKMQDEVNKVGVAFYIAPIINGVIRAGTMEEKRLLFLGFIEEPTAEYVDSVTRGNAHHETYYRYVARTAYNIKNRQDTEKKKCFKALCEKIEANNLHHHQVIVVLASKTDKVPVPQNITGLIAMELLKKYNKPVLVLRPKEENGKLSYAGSGRGKQCEGFNSFLQFVRDSQYAEYGEGHAFAFGASIGAENIDKFIAESDERLKDVDFSINYTEVDAIFDKHTTINKQMLIEFAKGKNIYGNGIPEPKIAIDRIVTQEQVMAMGSDGSSLRVTVDGVPCIKFKDKEFVDQITRYNKFKFVCIGRANLNVWMGRENAQLFIDEVEIEEIKSNSLF